MKKVTEVICAAIYVERWERNGKPRERNVRCTLPPGHEGRHGWELDKISSMSVVEP